MTYWASPVRRILSAVDAMIEVGWGGLRVVMAQAECRLMFTRYSISKYVCMREKREREEEEEEGEKR